jgi:hypothetical protein
MRQKKLPRNWHGSTIRRSHVTRVNNGYLLRSRYLDGVTRMNPFRDQPPCWSLKSNHALFHLCRKDDLPQ